LISKGKGKLVVERWLVDGLCVVAVQIPCTCDLPNGCFGEAPAASGEVAMSLASVSPPCCR
jgi:hypothetical protein